MTEDKADNLEFIKTHLPKYLTPDASDNLFKEVNNSFPLSSDPYKIFKNAQEPIRLYQGDCILDIPFGIFEGSTYKTTYLEGIVASNTCDIAPENERIVVNQVQFFPVFNLDEYLKLLKSKEISANRILTFVQDLKANRISNLFYLPPYQSLQEGFIRFDISSSIPTTSLYKGGYSFEYSPKGDRIFTFSDYGFYLFIIKLSIHYCRIREGVFRG